MARYLKHIYCECKFIETCISKIENWKFDASNYQELRLWMCIRSLLFSSKIILHLDISIEELDNIEKKPKKELNILEKQLLNLYCRHKEGLSRLKIYEGFVTPDSIDFTNKAQLTACYLTCMDYETCKKYSNNYGIMIISPDNIKEFGAVLFDNGRAIQKGDHRSWKNMLKAVPCNTLALADNYICIDDSTIRDNLIEILDALLPEELNLDIPFQISIFTTLKTNNNRDDVDSRNCLKAIAKLIEKVRPNLYFKLAIFKCKHFHDRTLVTNNLYINCPGGFDLMKYGKSSKTTMLNIVYPYINNSTNWCSDAYSNFINDISYVYNKSTEFQSDYLTGFYVGDKRNRLFI